MRLSNDPTAPVLEHNPDLDELPAAADALARTRERLLEAVRHSTDSCGDRTEMAAAELLRQAVSIGHKIRRALAVLMVGYALLWSRAHRSEDEYDDLDDYDDYDDLDEYDDPDDLEDPADPDDAGDFRLQALDRLTEQLELLIEDAGKTSEGSSGDGRVRAVVDHRMRLIELDFDPGLIGDPAYRAAVVEAVNVGLGPVVRRREGVREGWLPEPDPVEQEPEAPDSRVDADAVLSASDALGAIEMVQPELARLLARISRDPRAEEEVCLEMAELIEEICLDAEKSLDESLPFLDGYQSKLPAKARLPTLTSGDLTELEGLAELFLELDMDEDPKLEQFPGADLDLRLRVSIADVARKIQRRDAARHERLIWQISARRMRSRMAEVESRTFEGRSRDGLVTARADGSLQLIDLELEADRLAEAADVEGAVVDAVNAALEEAVGERSRGGYMAASG